MTVQFRLSLAALICALIPLTASPAKASCPVLAVGVNAHPLWATYTNTDRATLISRVAATKLKGLRVDINWDWVEYQGRGIRDTAPGSAFATLSTFVDNARAAGLQIMLVVSGTPQWANGGQAENVPPMLPADYAAFMGWLSLQFKGRVVAYELWNEPNSAGFWTGTAAQYEMLVRLAGPAIKTSDSGAAVVVGSMAPYLARQFLQSAYAAGLWHDTFDAVSTHPYADPSNVSPSTPSPNPDVIDLPGVAKLHTLMLSYGDTRAMWFTEWGYSDHVNNGTEPPWARGVTQAQQADYFNAAIAYTRAHYPYVSTTVWYNDRNTTTGNVQEDNYGLMDPVWNPKPVYTAAQELC